MQQQNVEKFSNDDGQKENIIEKSTEEQPNIPENADIKEKKSDIPASWTEDSATIGGTRMMDMDELSKLRAGPSVVSTNESDVTQVHCFIDGVEKIFKLPISDANQVSGWEIGRDDTCDIVLDHASVSGRHAQIIHQNGRWKIVNLVSTNAVSYTHLTLPTIYSV